MFHFRNPLIQYYKPNNIITILPSLLMRCCYCNKTFTYHGTEFSGTFYIVLGPLCHECLDKVKKHNPAIIQLINEMERFPEKYRI